MLSLIAQLLGALSAAIGLIALISGATSKSPAYRKVALRIVQISMSLAALLLITTCVLGKGWDQAAYGLMLIVFGTGVTAFGVDKTAGAEKSKDEYGK